MVFLAGRPVQGMYPLQEDRTTCPQRNAKRREVVVSPERAVDQWPFRTAADPPPRGAPSHPLSSPPVPFVSPLPRLCL